MIVRNPILNSFLSLNLSLSLSIAYPVCLSACSRWLPRQWCSMARLIRWLISSASPPGYSTVALCWLWSWCAIPNPTIHGRTKCRSSFPLWSWSSPSISWRRPFLRRRASSICMPCSSYSRAWSSTCHSWSSAWRRGLWVSLRIYLILVSSLIKLPFPPYRQGDPVLPAAAGGGAHLIDGHVRVGPAPRKCSRLGRKMKQIYIRLFTIQNEDILGVKHRQNTEYRIQGDGWLGIELSRNY